LKLLLDEMFSPAIAHALGDRGHDVDDHDVVALARPERRAVVTTNLQDFRPLHAELITPGDGGHAGFVFVPTTYRRTRADVGRLVTALEARLAEYLGDTDLADVAARIQSGCRGSCFQGSVTLVGVHRLTEPSVTD
jgi:hypothetical protein